MMNWKTEAIEKLTQYGAKKQSLQSIPEELRRLESAMTGIRSASADAVRVSGRGGGREDMLLGCIVTREELERSLEQARIWVRLVDGALEVLDREARLVLDRFYINPIRGAAEQLAGDLAVDVKTVYRWKDTALRQFTVCLYGALES